MGGAKITPEEINVVRTCRTYAETPEWYQAKRTYDGFHNLRRKLGLIGSDTEVPTPPPTRLDDQEELWGHLEKADEIRVERLSQTAEETSARLSDNLPVGIAFLGDVHAGASGVRYDLLRRDVDIIRATEGLFVIGMGDYLENTKPQAKSGSALYHALFPSPAEQIEYITTRFRACQGKWLALCQGNHDAFDGKWAGIDRLPALASDLQTTYFTEGGGTVFAEVGTQTYTIIVRHNHRGNSKINTTNAQRRMFDDFTQWSPADAICIAHMHFNDLQQVSRKSGTCTYLRSGTYKTTDPYSQRGNYDPEYGLPLIVLYPDTKKIVPFRGDNWLHGMRFLEQERALYRAKLAVAEMLG